MYKKLKEEKVHLDFIKLTDYSNFNFEHIGKYIENVIPKKYDLFDYKQAKQAVLERLYNLHKQCYTLKKLIICDILRKTAN